MKLTYKHISDVGLNEIIEWVEKQVTYSMFKSKHRANLDALLELKQRREEDRAREANG